MTLLSNKLEIADSLFSIRVQGSRETIAALDVPQLLYLLVDIKPVLEEKAEHLPLNLCLVIDRSTSMKGARLHNIRTAANKVLKKLSPEDVVSIVAFSDRAEVILPPQKEVTKSKMMSALNQISASGGTELYPALKAAVRQMKITDLETHNNQLILLTDGHTYGDENECIELVQNAAEENIEFSALGIGSEWNDRFLDQLVSFSGGQSIYVESAARVNSYLKQRIEGIERIYAHNVRMEAEFGEGLELKSAFKVKPFAQRLREEAGRLNFGAAEGRTPLSILLEFVVAPLGDKKRMSVPIRLLADVPSQLLRNLQTAFDIELEVVDTNPPLLPPDDIVHAVQAMTFHQMSEMAWQDLKIGDSEQATIRLHTLAARLLEEGHMRMAQKVLAEADRLMTSGSMSGEGRKALKYGTRALMQETKITDYP